MGQVKIRLDDLLDQRLQRLADADRKPKATLACEILEDAIPDREMRIKGATRQRLGADDPEPAKAMSENLTEMGQRMADVAAHQAGDRRLAMEIYRVALQASVLAGATAVAGLPSTEEQKAKLHELVADAERLFSDHRGWLQEHMQAVEESADRTTNRRAVATDTT